MHEDSRLCNLKITIHTITSQKDVINVCESILISEHNVDEGGEDQSKIPQGIEVDNPIFPKTFLLFNFVPNGSIQFNFNFSISYQVFTY